MMESNPYSDAELHAEFDNMFPQGVSGSDVMLELAPQGWEASSFIAINHPSPAKLYEETLQMHRNLASLRRPDDDRPARPEPTMIDVIRDYRERPIEPDREARELVGQCLWDIFSDGHEVTAADGRTLDLGSFRGSGGFLADVLNRQTGTHEYDYLDFYMGTSWVAGRADLTPVYRMIFRRLRARGMDWVYHFPRLYAVDFRPLKQALEHECQDKPEWENYDPAEAIAIQHEEREKDEKLAELRESLEQGHRDAVEAALQMPPPATVLAYADVFGRFPEGWPPSP